MAMTPTDRGQGGELRRDGRRTDTRHRIHEVALEVFSERGWESATLREIAERLDITRPALYYHFKSKEDILGSIHNELARSLDDIVEWARSAPAGASTRTEILHRLLKLISGSWGSFMQFAQRDESAMRNLKAAEEFSERMNVLAELLSPADTISGRIKARLALDALFMVRARDQQLGGTTASRKRAALQIAVTLVS